jgi:hypothetical protein
MAEDTSPQPEPKLVLHSFFSVLSLSSYIFKKKEKRERPIDRVEKRWGGVMVKKMIDLKKM